MRVAAVYVYLKIVMTRISWLAYFFFFVTIQLSPNSVFHQPPGSFPSIFLGTVTELKCRRQLVPTVAVGWRQLYGNSPLIAWWASSWCCSRNWHCCCWHFRCETISATTGLYGIFAARPAETRKKKLRKQATQTKGTLSLIWMRWW